MNAKKVLIIAIALLLTAAVAQAQYAPTGTSTLSVLVGAEASLSITTATTTFAGPATPFANFAGTTNFSYKIRTGFGAGTGSITVKLGGALTGTASSSNTIALSNLSYICTDALPALGTGCTTAVGASSTTATPVATFSKDAHSADAGTSGNSLAWTLVNLPSYVQDTYTATATFTISAT